MNAVPHRPRLHRYPFNHLTRALVLGGIGWVGVQTSTLAVDRTWTGAGGNSLWSNGGNWNTAPVTTGADSVIFGTDAGGAVVNDFEGASFGRIGFAEGAQAYTLQGNSVVVVGLNNDGSAAQTINLNLNLSGATNSFRAWAGDLVVNGVISGTGRITTTSNATGTVHLNGNNSAFSGGVGVNSRLHVGHANALGTGVVTISTNGTMVTFGAGIGTVYTGGLGGSFGTLLLEDQDGAAVTLHLSTGNGSVARSGTMTGKGGLVLDAGSGKQILDTANSYTGGTWIKSGVLELGGAAGNITGAVVIDGGQLSIQRGGTGSKAVTLTGLSGTGGRVTANTGSTATLNLNSTGNHRYAGNLENGTGALIFNKQGSGTFAFAGVGTYSGATTVSAGVYRLEGSLTASSVSVNNGATFEGAGGTVEQTLTLKNGSSLLFNITTGLTEPLLTVNNLTLESAVDLKLALDGVIAGGTEIQLIDFGAGVTGSFATLNGEAFPLDGLVSLTYGAQEYLFQYQESAAGISLVAVPEPQGVAMILLGAGAVLGSYWTRRRSGANVAAEK